VTGEEAFEVAAAVAAISGLAALLILCLVAIVGAWRLLRLTSEASVASTRATLGIEELARNLAGRAAAGVASTAAPSDRGDIEALRQQVGALIEEQRRLEESTRDLLDAAALSGETSPVAFEALETTVNRLENTVGQMAASLANLIQVLDQRQGR
jgi:hypothetical protein